MRQSRRRFRDDAAFAGKTQTFALWPSQERPAALKSWTLFFPPPSDRVKNRAFISVDMKY